MKISSPCSFTEFKCGFCGKLSKTRNSFYKRNKNHYCSAYCYDQKRSSTDTNYFNLSARSLICKNFNANKNTINKKIEDNPNRYSLIIKSMSEYRRAIYEKKRIELKEKSISEKADENKNISSDIINLRRNVLMEELNSVRSILSKLHIQSSNLLYYLDKDGCPTDNYNFMKEAVKLRNLMGMYNNIKI